MHWGDNVLGRTCHNGDTERAMSDKFDASV